MQLNIDNFSWKELEIIHGNMPGEMYSHEFFTYESNLYSMGGKVGRETTD